MLFIARRIGESIRIGTEVEVKIVRASGSRVLLAIEAPRSIRVLRVEKQADRASPPDVHASTVRATRRRSGYSASS
jgi:carbon storage regulator CsrA